MRLMALLLILATSAHAVTFDSAVSVTHVSTTGSWFHTVANQSNRCIFVQGAQGSSSVSITAASFAGVAMAQLTCTSSGTTTRQCIWYLMAPATGTGMVSITFSSSVFFVAGSYSYYGVKQSGNFTNLTSKASGFDTTPLSLTITTTTANSLVLALLAHSADGSPETWGGGFTSRLSAGTSAVTFCDGADKQAATVGQYNAYWSHGNTVRKHMALFEILSASSNPVLPGSLMMLGIGR